VCLLGLRSTAKADWVETTQTGQLRRMLLGWWLASIAFSGFACFVLMFDYPHLGTVLYTLMLVVVYVLTGFAYFRARSLIKQF